MLPLNINDIIPLTITRLGGLGDGVGIYQDNAVFVPLTAVGDEVRAEIVSARKGDVRARLVEVVRPGPRQDAPCMHFGVCGGCSLQHLLPQDSTALKRDMLAQIIRRLGVSEDVLQGLVSVGAGARRRVEIKVAVQKGVVQLGFFGMRSHALVDVMECPVTRGDIVSLFAPLRELIASLKKPGNVKAVHITQTHNGFDVMFTTADRLAANDRQKIAAFDNGEILRLSERVAEGEVQIIATRGVVEAVFGGIAVELPAPAFLQATEEGQAAITEFIIQHTEGAKRVVDLYSGCGTYSFPLQQKGRRISAYEGSYEMVTAMQNAIRRHGLEERMDVASRDLFANPVKAGELKNIDAAIINPPRNGAESQAKELARSGIPKIVMVSCNPSTFERDARHLLAAGYKLINALPIDQFHWSAHLELVAAFEKTAETFSDEKRI